MEEWLRWRDQNAWATDRAYVADLVQWCRTRGVVSSYLGPIPPERVAIGDANFRESFRAGGFNPRLRAVLDALADDPPAGAAPAGLRIYAPEATTPFALALRGRYPRFWGSEYLPDPEDRRRHFPIPHEDLARLSFPDAAFDVVVCNEVFEHVPALDAALGEIARVLRPGGVLLATFPFAYNQYETIVKAVLRGGEVHHLTDPEYHPNPVDPRGSLVYQIPGWDVLDLTRKQGFSRAENRFVSSRVRGICATELAGIFLMRAVR
ncbi:MAG: class I SAM-dependent methyltransferase [Deltaproteobacteria bacterium]|nr:class I SAM-dependent methyltransferase [Deltaproteobacteria bacterium]